MDKATKVLPTITNCMTDSNLIGPPALSNIVGNVYDQYLLRYLLPHDGGSDECGSNTEDDSRYYLLGVNNFLLQPLF